MKLLFICSQNRWRCLTAKRIFDGVAGHQARSAGTEPGARIRVTAGHLGWADLIFVMEKKHLRRVREKFPEAVAEKRVICLNIPDEFQLMQQASPALRTVLKVRSLPRVLFSSVKIVDATIFVFSLS